MKDFDGVLDVEEMVKALRRWAELVYKDMILQILDHRGQGGKVFLSLQLDKDRITAYIASDSSVRHDAEQLVAQNQEAQDRLLRLKRKFESAAPAGPSGPNGVVHVVDRLVSNGNGGPTRKNQSRKAEKAREDRKLRESMRGHNPQPPKYGWKKAKKQTA